MDVKTKNKFCINNGNVDSAACASVAIMCLKSYGWYLGIEYKCRIRHDAFLSTQDPVVFAVDSANTNHSDQFTSNSSPLHHIITDATQHCQSRHH